MTSEQIKIAADTGWTLLTGFLVFFMNAGFGLAQLLPQLEAVVTVGAFSFVTSLLVWMAIDKVVGLRVAPDHEIRGLDLAEMGVEAYPGGAALASVEEAPATTGIAAAEPPSFG